MSEHLSSSESGAPKAQDDAIANPLTKGCTVAKELGLPIILCAQLQSEHWGYRIWSIQGDAAGSMVLVICPAWCQRSWASLPESILSVTSRCLADGSLPAGCCGEPHANVHRGRWHRSHYQGRQRAFKPW